MSGNRDDKDSFSKSHTKIHTQHVHIGQRQTCLSQGARGELPPTLLPVELKTHDVQVTPVLGLAPCARSVITVVVLNKPVQVLMDDEPTRNSATQNATEGGGGGRRGWGFGLRGTSHTFYYLKRVRCWW